MAIVALVVGIIPIPPVSMLHMFVFSGEAANAIFINILFNTMGDLLRLNC